MTESAHTKEATRSSMDRLTDSATHYDVDSLPTIYHKDFPTTLVLPDSTVATDDKEEFIAYFRKQTEERKLEENGA